eukprot:g23638.t1
MTPPQGQFQHFQTGRNAAPVHLHPDLSQPSSDAWRSKILKLLVLDLSLVDFSQTLNSFFGGQNVCSILLTQDLFAIAASLVIVATMPLLAVVNQDFVAQFCMGHWSRSAADASSEAFEDEVDLSAKNERGADGKKSKGKKAKCSKDRKRSKALHGHLPTQPQRRHLPHRQRRLPSRAPLSTF